MYYKNGTLLGVFLRCLIISIEHYSQNITFNGYNNLVNNSLERLTIQTLESNLYYYYKISAHKTVFVTSGIGSFFTSETMPVCMIKENNVYTISFNSEVSKFLMLNNKLDSSNQITAEIPMINSCISF